MTSPATKPFRVLGDRSRCFLMLDMTVDSSNIGKRGLSSNRQSARRYGRAILIAGRSRGRGRWSPRSRSRISGVPAAVGDGDASVQWLLGSKSSTDRVWRVFASLIEGVRWGPAMESCGLDCGGRGLRYANVADVERDRVRWRGACAEFRLMSCQFTAV